MTVYDCVSVGAGACLDASIAGVLGRLFAHGSIGLLYMLTLLALNLWFLWCFYHISIPTLWNTSTSCRRRLLDAQGGCVRFGFPHFLVLICSLQRATLGCTNTRENVAPMSMWSRRCGLLMAAYNGLFCSLNRILFQHKSKLSDGESRAPFVT